MAHAIPFKPGDSHIEQRNPKGDPQKADRVHPIVSILYQLSLHIGRIEAKSQGNGKDSKRQSGMR